MALLLIAGIDTTWSAIGASLWHLARTPQDRERLIAEPELLPTAMEEFLRAYAPVTMARLVKEDMHWHGVDMKADDWILLSFPAANRDPAQFDRAGEVVIDREINRHAAFGLGIHRCVGSHLARMELRVALEVWLERIPSVRPRRSVGCDLVRRSDPRTARPPAPHRLIRRRVMAPPRPRVLASGAAARASHCVASLRPEHVQKRCRPVWTSADARARLEHVQHFADWRQPMNIVGTYLLYLLISTGLTVLVGIGLARSGRAFLLDVFGGNDTLARAVSRLLVLGFYLLSLGFVTLTMRTGGDIGSARAGLQLLSVKIGEVLLVLGVLPLVALTALVRTRRRAQHRPMEQPEEERLYSDVRG